jgi:SAM-dependent methyltransferase
MTISIKHAETVEELSRQGHQRLYPRLSNPNYLILRRRRELFQRWLEGVPGNNLRVLDVGGRLQPYRPLIQHRAVQYVAVDVRPTVLVDVVGRAEQLPFVPECFDLVFCTQVLEYIPSPATAIAEIHRVLKPGGFLLVSAPTIFPRDADEEYWRFEPAALRFLLASFARTEILPEGRSVIGMFRTLNVFLVSGAKFWLLRMIVGCTVSPILNLAGLVLETLMCSRNDQFTANYSALAQK